ncbi:MAG: DNA repair protein RadA [Flavobacteriales bacterium]|nr:DNA repair protein RadA [Flavobacteriales bacterium]
MGKVHFYCQNCGNETPKWHGRCPICKEWNTIAEEIKSKKSKNKLFDIPINVKTPIPIQHVVQNTSILCATQDPELDTVLGGGIVAGSIILLAGEPGIGKSTLLLQMALSENKKILYVSGEEAETQIKIRADRLGIKNEYCDIYSETSTKNILHYCSQSQKNNTPYKLIIIDSIQTLYSDFVESPIGSVSQIKQCCAEMLQYAKQSNTAIILIGHITKDGQIAGPKILEHMVDVVLHFEGEKNHLYRILRAKKNRFGPTSKVGVYEMKEAGLEPVLNPSTILIDNNINNHLSGTAIASTFEGQKTFLVEVQSLVTPAVYGTPQRSCNGFNLKRLNMLLAVLEKKCGFKLSSQDVFLNIAGGISVSDPSMDLAVIASVLSSNEDISINSKICFAGEVGLNGEIRPIPRIENHIEEAARIGFTSIVISSHNKQLHSNRTIKIVQCARVMDVYDFLSKTQ